MSRPTRHLASFATAALALAGCSPTAATSATTQTDYAASGRLAIAAPTHEDLAAGLRLGACLVQAGDNGSAVYVWLARVPTGPAVSTSRSVQCRCDGAHASVVESVTMGARSVRLEARVESRADATLQEEVRLDGAVVDPNRGRLLLVDLRGDGSPRQVTVALPPAPLAPLGGDDSNARAVTYARDLLPRLQSDPQVRAFLDAK